MTILFILKRTISMLCQEKNPRLDLSSLLLSKWKNISKSFINGKSLTERESYIYLNKGKIRVHPGGIRSDESGLPLRGIPRGSPYGVILLKAKLIS
jgi:hypothetical protein